MVLSCQPEVLGNQAAEVLAIWVDSREDQSANFHKNNPGFFSVSH